MKYHDDSFTTHQLRTVYDSGNGTMNQFWDANGNLAQVVDCNHNAARLHEWDEENRLTFFLGNRYAGYYGYDANGERVYKLVGTTSLNQLNGGYMDANVLFDACVLYPNPYMVVTKSGYTKHYYAGTERLATVIGGGGLGELGNPIDQLSSQHDLDIVSSFHSRYSDSDPFEHANNLSEPVGTVGIDGISHSELEYTCSPIVLTELEVLTKQNIQLETIEQSAPAMTLEQNVYFFHGDHLGSANWITDGGGNPIQYIHYATYGEQIANQQTIGYDERFKFTGKERDWETGYDYFGARFYDSRKGFWNSVDPLADKYPGNTPYLYCGGNPIMLVDPDGRSTKDVIIGYSLGILTSLIPGTSFLRDTYTPNSSVDYNTALATVDKVSLIVGSEMAIAGASGVGAGSAIVVSGGAAASTIIGAPEGAAIAVGGVAVITGSEALAAGGTMIMANAVSNKAQGYNRGSSKTSTSSAPKSINQLNQDVKRGKAPKGITDFHTGKVVGEQEHVHFKDGSALNKDGTWKHGDGKKSLTIEQAQYLKQNGWNIEY